MAEIGAFVREVLVLERNIGLAHRDMQANLLASGYERAVQTVPVQTGALRSEHIMVQGDPAGGAVSIVFEDASRIGPDTPTPPVGTNIARPDVSAAREAAKGIEPLSITGVLNQRFYASQIHDGLNGLAPRPWMNDARDYVEFLAGVIQSNHPLWRD